MKFKDLQIGEKFIAQPSEEDNLTSNMPFYIFMKIILVENYDTMDGNAVRLKDGSLSHMPDGMEVLKVE